MGCNDPIHIYLDIQLNHCKNNAITTEMEDDCLQMLNHMFTKQKALIANSSDNMLTTKPKCAG